MADPLYLSLWFPSFEADDMLPHALAVMRQFPFSVQQPGITYLALHPVSWNEPTILERRFRPGIPTEQAVLIASDLLHEDYLYMFEAFWDLWIVTENGEWTLQRSQVKFLVHGTEFDDGVYQQSLIECPRRSWIAGPLADPTDLPDGRFREYRVQPCSQKYFASRFGRNTFIDSAIPPDKGAYRDRHGRAAGCGGRGGVGCAIVDRRAGFP